MKKITLCIAILLCLGMFAYAGGQKEAEKAGVKGLKHIEFDADSPTGGQIVSFTKEVYSIDMLKPGNWKDSGVWESLVKEKFNIDIKMTNYPFAQFGEKLQMLIVSDDLPELFFTYGFDMNNIDKLGIAGRLYALDEFFPIMPNVRKMFLEDNKDLVPWLTAPDGHIYHLSKWGSYAPYGITGATHLIRHDAFEHYGIEQKWDTYDDFYDTLKKLKNAEPKYYPWGTRGFPNLIASMCLGFNTGWGGGWKALYYDDRDDKWKYAANDPGFKELIAYLARAYAEGLLHPEVPTMDSNLFFKHWADSTYQGLAINSGDTPTWESSWLYGERDDQYRGQDVRWMKPPVSNVPGARALYKNNMIDCWSTNVGHCISKKTERPDVLARFLDYMASEEGMFFFSWGKEDVTYRWFNHPDYGKIPIPKEATPEKYKNDSEFYGAQVSLLQHDEGFGDWGVNIKSDPFQAGSPYCGKLKGEVQLKAKPYMRLPAPRVMVDEFTNELLANKRADLQKYLQASIIGFVMGKKPLSEWDEFIAELKKMDVDLVLDLYNKSYKETQETVSSIMSKF